jgi:AraC-like DNA-binding protein
MADGLPFDLSEDFLRVRYIKVGQAPTRDDGWTHQKTDPHIIISHVRCGAYTARWAGQTVHVAAGEAYVAPPHTPLAITHHIDPRLGRMERSWIHLSVAANEVLDVADLLELPTHLDRVATEPFVDIMDELLGLTVHDLATHARRRELAYRTLRLLAALSRPRPGAAELLSRRSVLGTVIAHLHQRLDSPHDVAELARVAGVSAATLHRHFLAHTRSTPLRYLKGLRLDAACRLLAEGDLPLSEVAARVGFANPFHFSREFSRRFHASPASWRALALDGQRRR